MSQSARLKKTGTQEIGARLGTLSKANRETVEVTVNDFYTFSFSFVVMTRYYSEV